ncbi:MAG: hypothetical protein GY841_18770 [FCB group bacterium]|nr:hypothetical protein [FCB group bacterium]
MNNAVLCILAICGLLTASVKSIDIQETFVNLSDSQQTVIREKIKSWEQRIEGNQIVTIRFSNKAIPEYEIVKPGWEYLYECAGNTILAQAGNFKKDLVTGMPTSAEIDFTTNGAITWYWGITPPGAAQATMIDGWTVANHEICHALGFSIWFPNFEERVTSGPGDKRTFTFDDGTTVTLVPEDEGTHLDPTTHANDLMNPCIPNDIHRNQQVQPVRLGASPVHTKTLNDAHRFGGCVSSQCSGSQCNITFKSTYNSKTDRITHYAHNNQTVYNSCFEVEGDGIDFNSNNLVDETTNESSFGGVAAAELVIGKLCCGDNISGPSNCTTCNEEVFSVAYWRLKAPGNGRKMDGVIRPGDKNSTEEKAKSQDMMPWLTLNNTASFGRGNQLDFYSYACGEPGDYTVNYVIKNNGPQTVSVSWEGTPIISRNIQSFDSIIETVTGFDTTILISSLKCDSGMFTGTSQAIFVPKAEILPNSIRNPQIWRNYPSTVTMLIYDIGHSHTLGDIDPQSLWINQSLKPLSAELNMVSSDTDRINLALSMPFLEFVQSYPIWWDTVHTQFTVSGNCYDGTEFSLRGAFMAIGYLPGDVNFDGQANLSDAMKIMGYLNLGAATLQYGPTADVNADGLIDMSDVVYLINYCLLGGSSPTRPEISPFLE